MLRVGILGATGYAGVETVRLLLNHSDVKITRLVSHSYAGQKISDIYPNLKGVLDEICTNMSIGDIADNCDLVFTALPHGASKEVIPELYRHGVKIVDLSGDFRYNDKAVYEEWYGEPHTSPELLEQSVYGLPELHREEIKKASLVGNPGCYTTCSILALAPLLAEGIVHTNNIIIDAKSGVTGAGRGVSPDIHYCEVDESIKAYKIGTHRHTSEIEQELSLAAGEKIMVSFTPHLIPVKRGILATSYANCKQEISAQTLVDLYREYYKDECFVRVYNEGMTPRVNYVAGSNFIDIGMAVDNRLNRIVVVSCLDNLIKGAAGQAIQNMNIMCGFDEKKGLEMPATYL